MFAIIKHNHCHKRFIIPHEKLFHPPPNINLKSHTVNSTLGASFTVGCHWSIGKRTVSGHVQKIKMTSVCPRTHSFCWWWEKGFHKWNQRVSYTPNPKRTKTISHWKCEAQNWEYLFHFPGNRLSFFKSYSHLRERSHSGHIFPLFLLNFLRLL